MLSFILLLYMHIWFLITAKTHTSSIAFPNHFGWLNHTIIARVFLNLMFLLKCQNFNCFDIYVCKFTSCSHTYQAKPQRSYIWVTLQLRGDQIRGDYQRPLNSASPFLLDVWLRWSGLSPITLYTYCTTAQGHTKCPVTEVAFTWADTLYSIPCNHAYSWMFLTAHSHAAKLGCWVFQTYIQSVFNLFTS